MFSHRSFLVLDGGAADILSLIKGGLELLDCNFTFQQGIDHKGKATTRVHGGKLSLTLSQLPPANIIEWALSSRSYKDGAIIVLNSENIPLQRIIFGNAACTGMGIVYSDTGENYAATKLAITAETLVVGDGISLDNEWIY